MEQLGLQIFYIIIGFLIGYLIAKIYFYIKIKKLQKKSVNKSKAIILGQVYEHISPFLKDFKYNPKDMVFIGKGVDYIIFDGLSQGKLKKIIFLEVKSGKSSLNTNEKQIKQIVGNKKVFYEIFKI